MSESLSDLVTSVVEQTLKPLIAVDGGSIEVVRCNSDGVVLRLAGTCLGCPGRPTTVSRVIEPALRRAIGDAVPIEVER